MIEKDLSTKLLKIWSINLFLLQESIFKMVNNYTVEADKNELLMYLLLRRKRKEKNVYE